MRFRGAEDDKYRWLTAAGTYSENPIQSYSANRPYAYVGSNLVFEQYINIQSSTINPGTTLTYPILSFYDVIASDFGNKALLITDAYMVMGSRLTGSEGLAGSGGSTEGDFSLVRGYGVTYDTFWLVTGEMLFTTGTSNASRERIIHPVIYPTIVGTHSNNNVDQYTDVKFQLKNSGSRDIVPGGGFRIIIIGTEI